MTVKTPWEQAAPTSARTDFGTAQQAVDWILDNGGPQAPGEVEVFLDSWRTGDLSEWPDYLAWLNAQPPQLPEYVQVGVAIGWTANGVRGWDFKNGMDGPNTFWKPVFMQALDAGSKD